LSLLDFSDLSAMRGAYRSGVSAASFPVSVMAGLVPAIHVLHLA
jgi:hypothetical protein